VDITTIRPTSRPPGRRPPARRLLPGIHRDGQRRPRRPAHPHPTTAAKSLISLREARSGLKIGLVAR